MTIDKRELIILRIVAAFGAAPGMNDNVFRDRGDLPGVKLPAGVVLDGSERSTSKIAQSRGSRNTSPHSNSLLVRAPLIMELTPEIYWVMDPFPLKRANEYGPLLSQWRVKIIKAILLDDQLASLVGPNGDIEYNGSDTDMQSGRTMEGQMQFYFTFRYVLNPSDL
jgi:hypothetical protein